MRDALGADDRHAYVVFCASPGGNDDYAGEVAGALQLWDGAGRFVFTSRRRVRRGRRRPRRGRAGRRLAARAKLLRAEEAVRAAGGTVVRLAGLYTLERGAHNAWFNMGEVKQRPDGLINQVHYDDAAACVVAALANGAAGATYLAADDAPLSREAICRAAARAPRFAGSRCRASSARAAGRGARQRPHAARLGWAPAARPSTPSSTPEGSSRGRWILFTVAVTSPRTDRARAGGGRMRVALGASAGGGARRGRALLVRFSA